MSRQSDDSSSPVGKPNGASPESIAITPDRDTDDDYDIMLELDRLEELIEMFDELGVTTRDELVNLTPDPDIEELMRELDREDLQSRGEIESLIKSLEIELDGEPR